MILFGLFAWAFAAAMAGRKYTLVIPLTREAVQRHKSWRRAGLTLVALGPILTIIAAALNRDNASGLSGVSLAGLLFLGGNEWKNGLGVRLTGEDDLTVTRVHPDFERAWRELNQR